MNFKITGKIINILPETKGTSNGKDWKKRLFVIETDEQYAKKIAFDLFNKTLDFGINAQVEVDFSVESNEYNGKYYTNAKAFAIKLIGVPPLESSEPKEIRRTDGTQEEENLPF